ncbi:unnamed protein product [Vitrella brassicaformis CCMP3155]|uniref:Uncharacterized protein n=1 Tax=Vitrella brassicaformis (strain CCMP3155) TaxID=1169540 RepID=A0A0G4FY83_VITBC|nr:unnamed protein product [Vitrella brassicaformis CCMP3155]|eukprot:CEM20402.1 unnamed protein product [Vitrella brassicaformis CCMP3155]
MPTTATAFPPEDAQPHLHFLFDVNSIVNQTANTTTADGLQEVYHHVADDEYEGDVGLFALLATLAVIM